METAEQKAGTAISRRIKDKIHTEYAKMSGLSLAGKVEYIWDYYKWQIIAVILAVIVACSMIGNLLNPTHTYLQCAAINLVTSSMSTPAALTSDFHSAMQLEENEAVVYEEYYITFGEEYTEDDMVEISALYANLETNDIDIFMMTEPDFKELTVLDVFADLEEVLPAALWELVREDAVYITDPRTGTTYAAGLEASDWPTVKDCDYRSETVVLSVIKNSERLEHIVHWIYYIYGEEDAA